MLKFMRNKLVSIEREDRDTLLAHGILDDDIYSLQVNVSISISDLKIIAIDGAWNRWTTPECPRAVQFLQEAVGFRVEDGITQKVRKIIGRKACRNFANIILECCFSAKDAVMLIRWEDAKAGDPGLTFEEFLDKGTRNVPRPISVPHPDFTQEARSQKD
ncbi:MAG: DUF2889 domain-containing protein, partial [Thermodesulfobacteriota bacterium]|nr:DUF2889 domain-containing protein [Thermodesulfobacteriota bacterium]